MLPTKIAYFKNEDAPFHITFLFDYERTKKILQMVLNGETLRKTGESQGLSKAAVQERIRRVLRVLKINLARKPHLTVAMTEKFQDFEAFDFSYAKLMDELRNNKDKIFYCIELMEKEDNPLLPRK